MWKRSTAFSQISASSRSAIAGSVNFLRRSLEQLVGVDVFGSDLALEVVGLVDEAERRADAVVADVAQARLARARILDQLADLADLLQGEAAIDDRKYLDQRIRGLLGVGDRLLEAAIRAAQEAAHELGLAIDGGLARGEAAAVGVQPVVGIIDPGHLELRRGGGALHHGAVARLPALHQIDLAFDQRA